MATPEHLRAEIERAKADEAAATEDVRRFRDREYELQAQLRAAREPGAADHRSAAEQRMRELKRKRLLEGRDWTRDEAREYAQLERDARAVPEVSVEDLESAVADAGKRWRAASWQAREARERIPKLEAELAAAVVASSADAAQLMAALEALVRAGALSVPRFELGGYVVSLEARPPRDEQPYGYERIVEPATTVLTVRGLQLTE